LPLLGCFSAGREARKCRVECRHWARQ
jgi:hypothetical protein